MNRKLLQSTIAQLQADVNKLNKYFRNATGFLAEMAVQGKTVTEVLAPFKKFLTDIQGPSEAAKTKSEIFTVSKSANWINDEEVVKYLDYITLLETKWINRLGTDAITATATRDDLTTYSPLIAELFADLDITLFQDAKMFRALVWYVEAIGHSDLIADGAAWIKPINDFATDIQSVISTWVADRPVRVISSTADLINPFDLTAAIETTTGILTAEANAAVAARDDVDVVTPPVGTRTAPSVSIDSAALVVGGAVGTVTQVDGETADGTVITTTLSSSDDTIITVSGNTVTAVAGGTATVEATASDDGTVSGAPISITVTEA